MFCMSILDGVVFVVLKKQNNTKQNKTKQNKKKKHFSMLNERVHKRYGHGHGHKSSAADKSDQFSNSVAL